MALTTRRPTGGAFLFYVAFANRKDGGDAI
jgi:hypothetical protein